MGISKCLEGLLHKPSNPGPGASTVGPEPHGPALDVVKDEPCTRAAPAGRCDLTTVQERNEGGMTQTDNRLSFSRQPVIGVKSIFFVTSELDGYPTVYGSVLGLPDFTHSPPADPPEETITSVD